MVALHLMHCGESDRLVIRPTSWADEGQTLLYWEGRDAGNIGLLSVEGDLSTELLLDTEFNERSPAISPNGAWIAYDSDETERTEVYVQRFPALGGLQIISTDGGQGAKWSPDGLELFYRAPAGMMAVPVLETAPTLSVGSPELLFDTPYVSGPTGNYDIHPDGQRFLMVKDVTATDDSGSPSRQIVLVQDWSDELQRLVPTP